MGGQKGLAKFVSSGGEEKKWVSGGGELVAMVVNLEG